MSPALGIPLEKSTVIYHGVDDTFRRASTEGEAPKGIALEDSDLKSSHRFILVVSSVQEHRNLRRLLEAYSNLVQSFDNLSHLSEPALSPPKGPVLSETKEQALDLVIGGPIESVKLLRSLEKCLADRGLLTNVRFLDSVPSEELPTLYRKAELLVFPSLGETFGLPLIEAMASGLPVVASNSSAFPEICEDAACYFDPFDVASMTQAMERVLTDPSLRRTLVKRGLERALAFSWDKAASSLLSVMDTVAGRLK
jgi:glycosyltransferase involved in cell wall biosynthesis